ncbi:diphthamide synthesis protein [Candidatus Woesearchaeota archaeon]|nr:diphthamide synthesis protein [Candidatus Woesearchaeota archaeon]
MVQTIFIDGRWEKEIVLGNEVIEFLKKENIRSIALFASVQFLKLDKVNEQLLNLGIKSLITKAKRTDAPAQILGCDAYHDSFQEDITSDADAILYIGDGMFHPKALLLAQKEKSSVKDVIIWDPISERMTIIGKNEIEKQLQKVKANYARYLAANSIGILVTVKPGQQYLNLALKLKEKLENKGKKAFIFIDNTLDLKLLENYPFIEAWVNTACPRIGMDDVVSVSQPIINIKEALSF